jgi:hypothetical protein
MTRIIGILHEVLCTNMISRLFLRRMRNTVRARQAADDTVVLSVRTECCVTKATNKQSEYVVLNSFSTATAVTLTLPHCSFVRTLPVFFGLLSRQDSRST